MTLVLAMIILVVVFFLNLTFRVKATKAKINKWVYLKLKKASAEQTIYKRKKGNVLSKKISANHILDKRLINKNIFKSFN